MWERLWRGLLTAPATIYATIRTRLLRACFVGGTGGGGADCSRYAWSSYSCVARSRPFSSCSFGVFLAHGCMWPECVRVSPRFAFFGYSRQRRSVHVHRARNMTPYDFILLFSGISSSSCTTRWAVNHVHTSRSICTKHHRNIRRHQVRDCVYITDHAYTREEVLEMEQTILRRLKFELTVPTQWTFLVRFLKVCQLNLATVVVLAICPRGDWVLHGGLGARFLMNRGAFFMMSVGKFLI